MLLQIFIRDDESGLLDGEFRDGDIFATKLDGDPVGGIEAKTYLFIQVPDPANLQAFRDELGEPEYLPTQTAGEIAKKRFASKYRIDWRQKFTPAEIAVIEDVAQTLPDGTTEAGGTVTGGVVSGLFDLQRDLIRK